jgi:hypothetical protein
MSDPNETADLISKLLQAYREHAAAERADLPAKDHGEEDLAEDPGEDPDWG